MLETSKRHRLESNDGEIKNLFPKVKYLKIINSHLYPEQVVNLIIENFPDINNFTVEET